MPQDAGMPDPSTPLQTPVPRDLPLIAGRIEPTAIPRPLIPAAPPPPGLSAAPDLMSLLASLRRRWVSAVLLGGTLGAAVGVGIWFLLTPKHSAFATFKVSWGKPGIFRDGAGSAGDFKTFLTTTANEVVSRAVINAALKRDEVRRLGLDSQEIDLAQTIQEDLRPEFKETSELLTIVYSHPDPQVATTVLKGIQEAYLDEWVYVQQNQRNSRVTEMNKVYADSTDKLKQKRDNLKSLGEKLGTVDPAIWREHRIEIASNLSRARDQHVQAGFKLIEARTALESYDARVAGLTRWMKGDGVGDEKGGPRSSAFEEALEEAIEKDAEYKQIRTRIEAREAEITELRSKGYGSLYFEIDGHRRRNESDRKRLATRHAAIAERVKKAVTRAGTTSPAGSIQYVEDPKIMRDELSKRLTALTTMEEGLRKDIERLSKEAAKTPVLASEYEQLATEIANEDKNLQVIYSRLEQERVELRAAPRITKFQEAELMKRENKKQILAASASPIAVFAAVSLGLAWLEFRKRRVRAAGEISRGLGIRVVGAVPNTPHLERQLINASGESDLEGTPVMESIDAIRTRLLHEANTRSTRVVMVTSAAPGEGKTTLAAALATSLARAGRKTLLLDGDLRRPTVHELFEVAQQPGFSEVLLGEIEVQEAAVESTQENLWVMPAGQWDREVLLALSRDGIEGMFERLAEEFDFILVDSHPVLSATDSLLIGRQADAALLSVLREVSEMPRVYAASQQLAAVGVRVLGAVVNGTSPEEVYTSAATPATVA